MRVSLCECVEFLCGRDRDTKHTHTHTHTHGLAHALALTLAHAQSSDGRANSVNVVFTTSSTGGAVEGGQGGSLLVLRSDRRRHPQCDRAPYPRPAQIFLNTVRRRRRRPKPDLYDSLREKQNKQMIIINK